MAAVAILPFGSILIYTEVCQIHSRTHSFHPAYLGHVELGYVGAIEKRNDFGDTKLQAFIV
jgi:hypothetical protein